MDTNRNCCFALVLILFALASCDRGGQQVAPSPISSATIVTVDATTETPTLTSSSQPSATSNKTATSFEAPSYTPTVKVPPVASTTTPISNMSGYLAIIDGRGHSMVLIPAGTFTMGIDTALWLSHCPTVQDPAGCNPDYVDLLLNDAPLVEVTLTYDYWIDQYEVTNDQYRACVQAGVCPVKEETSAYIEPNYYGNPDYDDYPVLRLPWTSANTFCTDWRGGRLPTEAEWEYAARGTDGRLWPWGNIAPSSEYGRILPEQEYTDVVMIDPVEVGSYPAGISPFGVYDMAGNADEWVADWYGAYSEENVIDPVGSSEGDQRVMRGRADNYPVPPVYFSVIIRRKANPASHSAGFRCVREADT